MFSSSAIISLSKQWNNHIAVVPKNTLLERLRSLLLPTRPADLDQLASLATRFGKS